MKIGITTILKPDEKVIFFASLKSKEMNMPYFERSGLLSLMSERYEIEGFLIYGRRLPVFWTKEGIYKFHLGTAVLRIKNLQEGNSDRLCSLLPDDCHDLLDCTFGHGGDATVLSYYLKDKGKITSLEKSRVLYEIGKSGIEKFADKNETITEGLRKISLLHVDFREYLEKAENRSFDVIYFDTMFKHPVKREMNNVESFRHIAHYDELTKETLIEAMRVARKRIIIKERPFSKIFRSGLFTEIYNKKGQSTAYGVIDL